MGKVIITGGAGFIGGHTVDRLVNDGWDVRVMDALTPPVHPDGRWPSYRNPGAEYMRGDVRDRAAWDAALAGAEAVIHLAAYQDYQTDFSTFFDVNARGTAMLYEAAVANGIELARVVIASSQAVYGEAAYLCPEFCTGGGAVYPRPRPEERLRQRQWDPLCPNCGAELTEYWEGATGLEKTDEGTVNPANSYGISKVTQEQIGFTLGERYGLPTTCLRYSIVQGPRQSFTNAYSGILRIFTQRLAQGRPPICYEDGRQLRDYVSIHDVVEANVRALTRPEAVGEPFNIGGDRAVSVWEYAQRLRQRLDPSVAPQVTGEYRFGDTRHVISDVRKARALLEWQPAVSMEDIIDEYVEWALTQAGFADYSGAADAAMREMGCVRPSEATVWDGLAQHALEEHAAGNTRSLRDYAAEHGIPLEN